MIKTKLAESISNQAKEEIIKKVEDNLFYLLGKASMCWSETPKGVFDASEVARLGNEFIALLKEEK